MNGTYSPSTVLRKLSLIEASYKRTTRGKSVDGKAYLTLTKADDSYFTVEDLDLLSHQLSLDYLNLRAKYPQIDRISILAVKLTDVGYQPIVFWSDSKGEDRRIERNDSGVSVVLEDGYERLVRDSNPDFTRHTGDLSMSKEELRTSLNLLSSRFRDRNQDVIGTVIDSSFIVEETAAPFTPDLW
jgi:hypothetical protein